jgi:hypothetical protein
MPSIRRVEVSRAGAQATRDRRRGTSRPMAVRQSALRSGQRLPRAANRSSVLPGTGKGDHAKMVEGGWVNPC